MDIDLDKDEAVVKNWDYATAAEKGFFKPKTDCSLIITDKRIVHLQSSKNKTERKEIPINSVTAVETSLSETRPLRDAIILGAFGILLIVLGILIFTEVIEIQITLAIIFTVAGVLLILTAVLIYVLGLKVRLNLNVKTNINISHTDRISISANMFSLKKRSATKHLRVNVDHKIAQEIVNSIGAILIANKD